MKVMYKTIIFMVGLLIAGEYYFAKLDWKTRRKFHKKARKLQNKAGHMLNMVSFDWK